MLDFFRNKKIICHGTKFNVPERHRFWSSLYENAHFRFFLVGKTNKSWINKNSEQRDALGGAVRRLARNGGEIKILSDSDQNVIDATMKFLEECVAKEIVSLVGADREKMVGSLSEHFQYSVSRSSHYRAVVSDDRLVFIPSLNSLAFHDEALVFELSKVSTPFEFHTYMSDIERMFDQESESIDISWQELLTK